LIEGIHRCTGELLERRWNDAPFGRKPRASAQAYMELFERVRGRATPSEIELLEREAGFSIDLSFLEELALHTQITKKKSDVVFEHGKLLYTPAVFPGVCEALDAIERAGTYAINRLEVSRQRGYAFGVRR